MHIKLVISKLIFLVFFPQNICEFPFYNHDGLRIPVVSVEFCYAI